MIPGLHRSVWVILLGASLLLSLAMGMRQSMGLFLPPVTKAFGLAAAEFTLAIAIQNMVWGLSQPFVGALADRLGLRPVMLAGGVLSAIVVVTTLIVKHLKMSDPGALLFIGSFLFPISWVHGTGIWLGIF